MIDRTEDWRSRSTDSRVSPSMTGMLMSSSSSSMSGSAASTASASSPWRAKRRANSPLRTWRRKRCWISSSKSASSSTARILAGAVIAISLCLWHRQLSQLRLQEIEIDRLGDEFRGAVCARPPAALVVAVGGHHHDGYVGAQCLDFTQEREPVHAGHVDVGQDDDQLRPDPVGEFAERLLGRDGEMQDIGAPVRFVSEALAEELGDVRFVVDNKDADAHGLPPDRLPERGKRMVNSVNSPGRLSTVIVPPCSWVTMS